MIAEKVKSAHALINFVQPLQRIFVHGAAATPISLLNALCEQKARLHGIEILHLHTLGPAEYANLPEFRVTNLFVGENLRSRLDYNRVDYLPCFLSEIPDLFRNKIRAPDIAIVQVSPPDSNGYCSLGTSIDIAKAAIESASVVLAQINPRMPRTHGDSFLPLSKITAFWEHEEELPEQKSKEADLVDRAIAFHAASLIENGATLQIGVGAVPDAVLRNLRGHKHLGVHTETFTDALLPLLESGAVNNSLKVCHRGKTVTSFVAGTKNLYRFVHDNPSVLFLESDYVNSTANIARNPAVVAINSAVEIDLTGQVVADSLGSKIISGVGGQLDFIRGAALSPGGKSIIALRSRTKSGKPKIVPTLAPGAGVVTTRAHVRFVVSEFGIAELYGKTLGERARALIAIADPADREHLERCWHEQYSSNNK